MADLRQFKAHALEGLARALTGEVDAGSGRRKAEVVLRVHGEGEGERQVSAALSVLGPGDVRSIDAREILQRTPEDGTRDFPAEAFAAVMLKRPILPWLFSHWVTADDPTKAASPDTGVLFPWMALIVVPDDDEVASVEAPQGRPNPVLVISEAADAGLPDPKHLHLYAHVEELDGDPVARLVAPRGLGGRRGYRACLVPTTQGGVAAGLGQPLGEHPARPAWASSPSGTLRLPLFDHWRFGTAEAADFVTLAKRLEPLDAAEVMGSGLQIVMDQPAEITRALPTALKVPGGLPDAPPAPSDDAVSAEAQALKDALGAQERDDGDLLRPPSYGTWPAGRGIAREDAWAWQGELNLHIGRRALAGAGLQIVRRLQESLMASAWEQFDELERINRFIRRLQAAREMSGRIHRRIGALDPVEQASLLGPLLDRLPATDGQARTARAALGGAGIGPGALSNAHRKFTRHRYSRGRPRPSSPEALLDALRLPDSDPDHDPVASPAPEGAWERSRRELEAGLDGRCPQRPGLGWEDMNEAFHQLRDVLRPETIPLLSGESVPPDTRLGCAVADLLPRPPEPPDLPELGPWLRNLDPEVQLPRYRDSRVQVPEELEPDEPFDLILAEPRFPMPVYEELVKISESLLIPGFEDFPRDSITLLETDPATVEAFFAGLNHEVARELRWRGFPTDMRGTSFRQFWDPVLPEGLTLEEAEDYRDIPRMHTWRGSLGDHFGAADPEDPGDAVGRQAVILIRGRLIERVPNLVAYITVPDESGSWDASEQDTVWSPTGTAHLGADVLLLIFDVSVSTLRSYPDAVLVLEEIPLDGLFGAPSAVSEGAWLPGGGASLRTDHSAAFAADLLKDPHRVGFRLGDLV